MDSLYKTILVTLDTTPTDRAIIEHIKILAKIMGSEVVLLHVATGVPAQFHGSNAAGKEVEEDRAYLAQVSAEFQAEGISNRWELAFGDPVREIVKWVQEKGCDLVAMSTHGHHFVGDLMLGSTASPVQHSVSVPVLLLRAK
ncbi:MAG TPA: universal stress protein [Tepidisphaeraceae bacterium]|nr:universal stress protein [Tepidisphaeraceae bacterium]